MTNVEGAASSLATSWQSDEASKLFAQAIAKWLTGFHRVQAGLDSLNENMATYASLTDQTEQENASFAGDWANG